MNFTQFSESRKSTRGFQEKPVPKEDAAPSGTTCKMNHRVVMDVPERGKYASSEAYSSEYSLPLVKYRTNKRPAHLKCSRLEHGFLRLRCATCRLERLVAISWTQRLKRVFNIDIDVCDRCAGSVKVIACIEDQDVIDSILAHLLEKDQGRPTLSHLVPPFRAPPGPLPFFAGRESTAPNQQGRY